VKTPQDILNKFIYYTLLNKEYEIKSKTRTAGIPTLDKKDVENITIPIPPLSRQKEIVEILDKFDTLVNDISKGLPREIELRRKQYEYYRERLVNFG
ncbi:MAG: restriction endonuclease subunit S, partial [Rickettsiales bacterium]|nr:restriction endonuclease subunit S [Rickettsiales bacterium]